MRRIIFGIILVGIAVSAVAQMLMQPSAESDALFAADVDLYNAGKYREAIPLFAKSDSLDKAQLDSTSNRRDYSSMWLASCYYQLGDTSTAAGINAYYQFAPVDRRLTVEYDFLSLIGLICYYSGDYNNAVPFGNEALNICEKVLGKQHPYYALSLNNLADYNSSLGNYAEAIRLGTKALQIREKALGKEHPNYATSLENFAEYNHKTNKKTEATKYCVAATEALAGIVKRTFADLTARERNLF